MQSTERFSSRVADYVKYRPGYPPGVLQTLVERCNLTKDSSIADIGSGTGISSELFLKAGYAVIGVEPNTDMRAAAEKLLAPYPHFRSINGAAEATTLTAQSVDVVLAGQAYHWFDPTSARREFKRILKPAGWVVIMWNERQTTSTPFLRDYERLLLDFGTDYTVIDHRNSDPSKLGVNFEHAQFPNAQHFGFEGVQGRLTSSSYVPEAGQPRHAAMLAELRRIFDLHQEGGQVTIHYTTDLFFGQFQD